MNITILYGRGLTIDAVAAQVAADVYEADEVKYVEEITAEELNALKGEVDCPSEEILVITPDDLSHLGNLRNLFTDCPYINAVQSVTNFNKAYSELFPVE